MSWRLPINAFSIRSPFLIFHGLKRKDVKLAAAAALYGQIPQTNEARLQQTQDQAASESIALNGTLFQFADQADEESRRIMKHAQVVNPGGAAKLTAQSIAVLIGVTTQVLRTNSMMLKMMGQKLPKTTSLPSLQTGNYPCRILNPSAH